MLLHGPHNLHHKMDAHRYTREHSLTIPIPNTIKRTSEYLFSQKLPISTQRKTCKGLSASQFCVIFAFDNFQFQAPHPLPQQQHNKGLIYFLVFHFSHLSMTNLNATNGGFQASFATKGNPRHPNKACHSCKHHLQACC